MLDVFISILSDEYIDAEKEALEFLFEYLFKVEAWGYYELRLYNSTMLLMPPKMVITLSKTAYEKSVDFREFKKVNDVIIAILLSTLTYLLGPIKYVEEYKVFLTYIENITIPENLLYSRNHLLYMKGVFEIKTGNREKGIAIVNKAISIFHELGSTGLVIEWDNYLQIILDYTE